MSSPASRLWRQLGSMLLAAQSHDYFVGDPTQEGHAGFVEGGKKNLRTRPKAPVSVLSYGFFGYGYVFDI